MMDVKRKLEHVSSFILPHHRTGSSPTVVQAIMKRVKGTDSWERSNLRKNTMDNVVMVKNPEVKEAGYVKPQRKLNAHRLVDIDDTSSSGSGTASDGSDKSVKFTRFVEEICFQSCTVDFVGVKAEQDSRENVLAILGLEVSSPKSAGGDLVVEAVCKAREEKAAYPKISMVPINDGGQGVGGTSDDRQLPPIERHPSGSSESVVCTGSSDEMEDSHSDGEDAECSALSTLSIQSF